MFAVRVALQMHRRLGRGRSFAIAIITFTALLLGLALLVDNHVTVTVLVIAGGPPPGVPNTLFTETAMNISPAPRPVASGGYDLVRILGGAVSPFICGKPGENVGPSAPFFFGAACAPAGVAVLMLFGRRHPAAITARRRPPIPPDRMRTMSMSKTVVLGGVGVMALSEGEQRRLDEIERALRSEDPRFAETITITRVRRHRKVLAVSVFVIGMVALVAGLVTTDASVWAGVAIIAIGVAAMITGVLLYLRPGGLHLPSLRRPVAARRRRSR